MDELCGCAKELGSVLDGISLGGSWTYDEIKEFDIVCRTIKWLAEAELYVGGSIDHRCVGAIGCAVRVVGRFDVGSLGECDVDGIESLVKRIVVAWGEVESEID